MNNDLSEKQKALLVLSKLLHIDGFTNQLDLQFYSPNIYSPLIFEDRLEDLLQAQVDFLQERRKQNLLKQAKLKGTKTINEIDTGDKKGLTQEMLQTYASLSWTRLSTLSNICICGESGSGKTSLVCAIGRACIDHGISVLYFNCNDLLDMLVSSDSIARGRIRLRCKKAKVLILDDLCLNVKMTEEHANCLFSLLEDRDKESPTVFATQLKRVGIRKRIPVPSIADAVIRRLFEKCYTTYLQRVFDDEVEIDDPTKITPDDTAVSLNEAKEPKDE